MIRKQISADVMFLSDVHLSKAYISVDSAGLNMTEHQTQTNVKSKGERVMRD